MIAAQGERLLGEGPCAAALEDAVAKVKANLRRRGDAFPHIGLGRVKEYRWEANDDWIEGFYTGLAWLSYEYTGDPFFRERAEAQVDSFAARLAAKRELDHHDIGFLYGPSAFAGWIVTGSDSGKELALRAADHLLGRWRETAGLIQAWGPKDDPDNGGRIIIDCLMNLPLLYWASRTTGDARYGQVAKAQAELSRRFLVRGDDSSYHTFYFDPANGAAIRGGTHQGMRDGSTWTRGQAWGIYGFALSYRYTGDPVFLETSKRMARYFIDRIPEDGVVYWDFDAERGEETSRDSSASAIAACGMLELLSLLEPGDGQRGALRDAVAHDGSAERRLLDGRTSGGGRVDRSRLLPCQGQPGPRRLYDLGRLLLHGSAHAHGEERAGLLVREGSRVRAGIPAKEKLTIRRSGFTDFGRDSDEGWLACNRIVRFAA